MDWERTLPFDVDVLDGLKLFFYNTSDNTIRIHILCPRRRTPTQGYIYSAGWYINSGPPYGLDAWAPGRDYYLNFNILKDSTVPTNVAVLFNLTERNSYLRSRESLDISTTGAFSLYVASDGKLLTATYRNAENSTYGIASTAQDGLVLQTTNVELQTFSVTNIAGFVQKDAIGYVNISTPTNPILVRLNPFTGTIN
jgi:hypothetical protein